MTKSKGITAKEYHELDTAERQERIESLKRNAPIDATFVGFGGSGIRHETVVFNYRGKEIRFPVILSFTVSNPDIGWGSFDQIEEAYGCLAFGEWYEVEEWFTS